MKRPSFQFYPADWRNNAKLRRCSEAARGAWMDMLCVLHDSDEYGVCRWPLADLARSAGVSLKLAKELSAKNVLKGSDNGCAAFTFSPTHAGKAGDTVILIEASTGPCWYCSRFVRDEWIRQRRGTGTQFTTENQPPKTPPNKSPKRTIGERQGDGPTSSSSSSSPSAEEESSLRSESATKRKPGTSLPEDFPTEPDLEYARRFWRDKGRIDLADAMNDHIREFRDHHTAKGTTSKSWPASWRTWCSNALKFNRKPINDRAGTERKSTPTDRAIRVLADIAGFEPGGDRERDDGARTARPEPKQLALVACGPTREDPPSSYAGADQRASGEAHPALLAAGHDGRADAFEIPRFLLRS